MEIAVIGLGYVGLPLARLFATRYSVVGFDINPSRVQELNAGIDTTLEIDEAALKAVLKKEASASNGLLCTGDINEITNCNCYIITVPTPVDKNNKPDLTPLYSSSETVGKVLKRGDIVVYESTVYPGVTEDECVPVLEKISGLKFNVDFFVGYSPERINPGDKVNTLTKIKKVTSGSTPEVAILVNNLYASIIDAGTHLASSIKVAEASKAIENAQRDVNISFVNELALIFDRMGIDTTEVLEAAGTKWNFLKYKPGLVGGHCIGVDPYYLAYKAESLGYYPQVILSGRRVNDMMGVFVANKLVKLLIKKGHKIEGSRVLILGITFKENCPDIRNTRVVDVYKELRDFGMQVDVYDPWASADQVEDEYGISLIDNPSGKYEAVVLAVAHQSFQQLTVSDFANENSVIFDLKSTLPKDSVDSRL